MDEQRSKSEADLKHELLTMQVRATQQMASNDQQRRLEIEELASELHTMPDVNAGILRQEQQAITSTRALEEAARATHRDAELKHQSDQEKCDSLQQGLSKWSNPLIGRRQLPPASQTPTVRW